MQSVSSVVIVGAGTAGWLTALALNTYCPSIKVSLVQLRGGSPIGVGESTQGDLTKLLHAARIDLGAFYDECDATLKCGILYKNWNSIGKHYWHPFADVDLGIPKLDFSPNYTVAHHYQQMILRQPQRFSHASYYHAVHSSYETCVTHNKVSPKAAIAFHIDASRLTEFLRKRLSAVEVVEADALEVITANGRVDSLVTDGSNVLKADLYVDCTGLNRALFARVTTPQLLPYVANVNRAVAARVPYSDSANEPTPYTGACAHEHGWTWAIPLQSRFGSGYVYHGDFCSSEQAERNFREYWGPDRMRDVEVSHIAFDSATLRNPWAENVLTVGLSAGFVEPLEATGLSWIVNSASLLCRALAERYYDQDVIAKYNSNILGYILDIQDFIDAHYKLSARRDTEFWRHQTSRQYPSRLENRLSLYAREMPSSANRIKSTPWAFHEVSWIDILNGYEFEFAKVDVSPAEMAAAEQALRAIAARPRAGMAPLKCKPPSTAARR